MTDEKINIAIAEACGWTGFNPDNIPDCLQYTARAPSGKWGLIPDYCNDLNAMHEAEKILSDESHADYACELVKTIRRNGEWFESVSATAAQRAEAFLRTINKWEGGGHDH
jgi:hypothetical protein